jgi:putative transposase
MIVAHRIALIPNNKQKTYFAKACGVARFAYNWALAEWQKQYEEWKEDNTLPKPSAFSLDKKLNSIKHEQFPWMKEVTSDATQEAVLQLGDAFKNFFKKQNKYPNFKKKGKSRDSFRIKNTNFRCNDKRIKLPKLGWVRMTEQLRFHGKLLSATVSRTADRWFVSIAVEIEVPSKIEHENQGSVVGMDLGVTNLAVLSDGAVFSGPKPMRKLLNRMRRVSRSFSRKKKGSHNNKKAKMKLARLHARISNIRKDATHKLTHFIAKNYEIVGMEDLNAKGMVRNHRLALSISDANFGEIKRQLLYKTEKFGGKVILADRFFPSSKTCSSCNHIMDNLPLKIRNWECPVCTMHHNRDINAAINLAAYAARSAVLACGEESSGGSLLDPVKLASAKQELGSPTWAEVL